MVRRTWCLVGAMLAVAGCAPGNPGLIVGGAVAPNEACILDPASPRLLRGTLDSAAARITYTLSPVLFNQLLNLSSTGAPPRADPNVINIQRAQVELRDINGTAFAIGALPNPYTVPATGFLPSSDGMSAGVGIGTVEIIPPAYGEELRGIEDASIIVVVRVIGITAGGAEVVSNEFHWPLDICAGCLFACVRDDDGLALCIPTCRPGQDLLTVTPSACATLDFITGCVAGGS